MKKSKKYIEASKKIEKAKLYTKEEACDLVKKTSTSNFDGSVEVAIKLNLDTRKSDQQLRGAIVLPNGTGKTKKVLVLAKGDAAKAATDAGADYVGDVDMLEKIEKEFKPTGSIREKIRDDVDRLLMQSASVDELHQP